MESSSTTGTHSTGAAAAHATRVERYDTIVIGAGQAGLATGYYLAERGADFVILDSVALVGDSWRERWDALARSSERYVVYTDGVRYEAESVVVATGPFQRPRIPDAARQLAPVGYLEPPATR